VTALSRHDITVSLIGFEEHKAKPDLSDDSGFWLCVKCGDVSPFVAAFNESPTGFHRFLIEYRVEKKTRGSTLIAQIIKIDQGSAEARVLIRPHHSFEAAVKDIARTLRRNSSPDNY
jgi:hypothetical protein